MNRGVNVSVRESLFGTRVLHQAKKKNSCRVVPELREVNTWVITMGKYNGAITLASLGFNTHSVFFRDKKGSTPMMEKQTVFPL